MTLKQGRRIIFDLHQWRPVRHQRRKIIKAVEVTMNDPVSYDKICRHYGCVPKWMGPRPAESSK